MSACGGRNQRKPAGERSRTTAFHRILGHHHRGMNGIPHVQQLEQIAAVIKIDRHHPEVIDDQQIVIGELVCEGQIRIIPISVCLLQFNKDAIDRVIPHLVELMTGCDTKAQPRYVFPAPDGPVIRRLCFSSIQAQSSSRSIVEKSRLPVRLVDRIVEIRLAVLQVSLPDQAVELLVVTKVPLGIDQIRDPLVERSELLVRILKLTGEFFRHLRHPKEHSLLHRVFCSAVRSLLSVNFDMIVVSSPNSSGLCRVRFLFRASVPQDRLRR